MVEALAEESAIEAEFNRRIHIVEPHYILKRREKYPGELNVTGRSANGIDILFYINSSSHFSVCS